MGAIARRMYVERICITAHPIAFGSGDWTATTGAMEATFSETMKLSHGKTIQPMDKKVKIYLT